MPRVTLANGKSFVAERNTSILDAAQACGVMLEYSCKTGRCGTCKAQLRSGETAALRDETSLTADEIAASWILTCTREALSDLTLDVDDLEALAGITTRTLACRIDGLKRLAPDVLQVVLRLPPNAGFAFLPGQYIDVVGPGGLRRSYSIASDARDTSKLELHVRQVEGGAMSDYWFEQARVNDLLRLRGPLGTFFLRDIAGLEVIFLATGTGYAPVQSMLRGLEAQPADQRPAAVRLFWGGRRPADLYLEPGPITQGLTYEPILSRADADWPGTRGHVHDALLAHRPALQGAVVYACGSDAMIHSARTALIAAGLPPKRFYSDAFVSSN